MKWWWIKNRRAILANTLLAIFIAPILLLLAGFIVLVIIEAGNDPVTLIMGGVVIGLFAIVVGVALVLDRWDTEEQSDEFKIEIEMRKQAGEDISQFADN